MKSHLPLLALVPCLLLAACSKPADDTAATPATPAPATPAQPAATTPAEGTATTPSATAETRAKSNLVPDVDYVVIPNGQPLQPLAGIVRQRGATHRHRAEQGLQRAGAGHREAVAQPGQHARRARRRGQRDAMTETQGIEFVAQPPLEPRPGAEQTEAGARLEHDRTRPLPAHQ